MLNPYQKYSQTQVNTASAEELPLMLYKGAVKFISIAMRALDDKQMEQAHINIIKAENIYYELLNNLDHSFPIAKDLARMYDFMLHILSNANIKKDKQLLEQALGFSREFVETWEEAIKIYRRSTTSKHISQTG